MATLHILLLVVLYFYHFSSAQTQCSNGCLCFKQVLECSGRNFKRFPHFPGYMKRSTVKLLLRRMPEINLMDEDFDIEWPSLKVMDLTG